MKTKYVFHGNQFYKKSIYVCLLRDLGRRKSNREGKTDVLSIRLAQGQMFPYIGVVLNDKFPFYRTKKLKMKSSIQYQSLAYLQDHPTKVFKKRAVGEFGFADNPPYLRVTITAYN